VSIPEVSSRARLIAFLRKFFASISATWQAPSYIPFGYAGSASTSAATMPAFTVFDQGYRMPAAGTLLNLSLQVTVTVFPPAPATSRSCYASVYKNGVYVDGVIVTITTAGPTTGDFGGTTPLSGVNVDFVAGDVITVKIAHSGSGLTTENWLALVRISNTTV